VTVGLIGKTFTDYANITKTNHIVKMDNWGINIDVPVDTIQNLNNLSKNEISLDSSETVSVAPGDSDGVGYTINGTPAVSSIDVVCQYDITIINPDTWKVDDEYYFPVEFAIEADDMEEAADWEKTSYEVDSVPVNIAVDDSKYDKIEFSQVDNKITITTTERLRKSDTYDTKYKGVAWAWEFYESDAKDIKDTKLGNYEIEAPQFKLQANIRMTWNDGVNNDSSSSGTDDNTGDGDDDTGATVVSTQSGDTTTSTLTQDRFLSGDTSDNNADTEANAINQGLQTLRGMVNTGDDFNLAIWVSLMAIAALVILAMIIILIKRNKKDNTNKF
jgi:hypothetical protein